MRDYSKFYTPKEESSKLVKLAAPLISGMKILEPSFGTGNIIKAIKQTCPTTKVTGYEIQVETHTEFANWIEVSFNSIPHRNDASAIFGKLDITLHNKDFISTHIKEKFDRIVANPPFDGDKWVGHLIKMFYLLGGAGRLVCVIPRKYIITGTETKPFLESYFGEYLENLIEIPNWATNNDGSTTELYVLVVQK